MIHWEEYDFIKSKQLHGQFLYPFYNAYSLGEVVPSILTSMGLPQQKNILPFAPFTLDGKKPRKIVMFIIDGLSFLHLESLYQPNKFFSVLADKGEIYPITSVFPSTTPAALTAIHTGLTPQEHGLPEWTVYFEEFNSIIETLPFKTWEMPEQDALLKHGGNAEMLYDGPTIYHEFAKAGVPSFTFTNAHYAQTAYSRKMHDGSMIIPFDVGSSMTRKLSDMLVNEDGPAYFFVYWGHIDSVAHRFGPGSEPHKDAIAEFSYLMMEDLFKKLPKDKVEDTLFLLSADHGQSNIKGDEIINLNKYSLLEESFLHVHNYRILPTGSPHDVFLHIHPPKVAHVVEFLKHELDGRAEVMLTTEALEMGLFGNNKPIEKFVRRIGNVIILPYPGYHVWYEFIPGNPYTQLGMHGGLSEEEMVIPFAVAPLKSLLTH